VAEKVALFFHVTAALWMAGGLVGVLVPLARAYSVDDLSIQVLAVEEASHYQGLLLLPGAIVTGTTGLLYWAARGKEVFGDPVLMALGLLYLVVLLVFLPLIGLGLRRLRVAAIQSRREGVLTPELKEALEDRVALTFLGLTIVLMPGLVALSLAAA